ncbi:UbiA family prenyltransferase [Lacticaseibacillus baoqingensis]|uniref:UbiA family prenyltransferase n=1 Tax=Lacticaseibacillus baoqingensis TaxID=2486013 RepID=A0ABW4E944_9LACO|nr:UbiA family prenyltransferase [Lacticaseibacillus baoqingensis]
MVTYRPLTWPLFLELIRLPAKAASLLPFLFGVSYAWMQWGQLDWLNTGVYFVGQMSIALFVTGFNNVQDFYKATDETYRQTQNIIGREQLDPVRILLLMLGFLSLACVMGLFLVWRTNLSLLLIGGAAVFVAIFYTFGPVPLSRLPSGELLAGLCEGFGTIFIAVFVNHTPQPVLLALDWQYFRFSIDMATCLQLFLVALPIVILDGTVMFADNICDLAQDQRNQRYTLPYYLGKPRALRLYPWLARSAFALIVLAVGLQALPWPLLATLGLWPLVAKNTRGFLAKQSKTETFNLAIKSLLAVSLAEVVLILLAGVMNF